MDEVRTDTDDDDEVGYSEDDHGEDEDGAGSAASHSKRRQALSFYFTTGTVKRMTSKEDSSLTATCQVGGYDQCSNIISMTNGDTQGVSHHFLKYHADLNVRIRAIKVVPEPPGLFDITEPYYTSDTGATANHSGHTQPRCDEGGQALHCH
jgi:hypothetical protein